MEEPEEYLVEEEEHFISEEVEAEPAEGRPALRLALAPVCWACPILNVLLQLIHCLYCKHQ